MNLTLALAAAIEAARDAGALLLADFHLPGGARGHGDKAEADVEAERLIRARLTAAFPSWGYLGEETGRVPPQAGQPVWLVDPNDGTSDYLVGRRGSAVSIGVAHEGRPILGVVFVFGHPDSRGSIFTWAEGEPLRRDGRELSAAPPAALGPYDVVALSGGADSAPGGHLDAVEPARYAAIPSIAHRLALVACGEAAATVSLFSPCAWDYGGGHALVRGAGGVLLNEDGAPVSYDADGWSSVSRAFAGSADVARTLSRRPWPPKQGQAEQSERPVRLQRGHAVADAGLLSRAQGCLLGQVAGDNLGAFVEFEPGSAIRGRYADGPRLLADGGHWDILAGQPTDDSEMALALAKTLVAPAGADSDAVGAAYRAWLASRPFDVGTTTRAGLGGRPRAESEANGSLMRCSPLGVFAHRLTRAQAAALARADSALTHPHPACGDAEAAFVVAVAHAVAHGDGPAAAHAAAVEWAAEAAAHPLVREALRDAEREAPVCDGRSIGWVRIALQNAFFELLHAPTLEEGVVATVRRGGDTDTNAAIAGALLGAVHGRDAVPFQWRKLVLSCRAHARRGRRPRPLPYWPVDLLELSERLLLAGE